MLTGLKRTTGLRPMEYGQTELIHTVRRCGLTSGLKLCLDAGDANSYSGSGQSWLDTSGNGYDFFRGATGSAAGDDPTFNGTAGQRSSGEYWSVDGGDFFRYDSANETWMNNLHKDNAIFTFAMWAYLSGAGVTACILCSTRDTGIYNGVMIRRSVTTGVFELYVNKTGGTVVLSNGTVQTISLSAWHFLAVSCNEPVGSNGGIMQIDGTQELFTSTYTSPGTTDPTTSMELFAETTTYTPPSGSRLGMFAAWEGVALTQAQLLALYQSTRGRFGV